MPARLSKVWPGSTTKMRAIECVLHAIFSPRQGIEFTWNLRSAFAFCKLYIVCNPEAHLREPGTIDCIESWQGRPENRPGWRISNIKSGRLHRACSWFRGRDADVEAAFPDRLDRGDPGRPSPSAWQAGQEIRGTQRAPCDRGFLGKSTGGNNNRLKIENAWVLVIFRCARQSWRAPAGGSPAWVGGSAGPVASVAWWTATPLTKRTQ